MRDVLSYNGFVDLTTLFTHNFYDCTIRRIDLAPSRRVLREHGLVVTYEADGVRGRLRLACFESEITYATFIMVDIDPNLVNVFVADLNKGTPSSYIQKATREAGPNPVFVIFAQRPVGSGPDSKSQRQALFNIQKLAAFCPHLTFVLFLMSKDEAGQKDYKAYTELNIAPGSVPRLIRKDPGDNRWTTIITSALVNDFQKSLAAVRGGAVNNNKCACVIM